MRAPALAVALFLSCISVPLRAGEISLCSEPGIPIPDDDGNGISDLISLDAPGTKIVNLLVDVEISHLFIFDLFITLEGPAGGIILADDLPCPGADLGVTFDDTGTPPASTGICADEPPVLQGPIAPLEPLASFNDTLTSGDWTLRVFDQFIGDTGTLVRWCITAVTEETAPPWPSFTADCSDLSCQFVDQSQNGDGFIVEWNWDFGDGDTSTEQNPLHEFPADDIYTVTLTVTDDFGATDSSSQQIDSHPQPPVASFTASCLNLVCDFTDESWDDNGTVVAWQWDFGDGNLSTLQNPQHTYATDDIFTVSLEVTDNDGEKASTSRQVESVPNTPPVADSQSLEILEDNPLSITLTGSDVDDDPITFRVSSEPQHGHLVEEIEEPQSNGGDGIQADGSKLLTYHPETNYYGPDSFAFQVFDAEDSSEPATIDINVIAVNDPPVFEVGPAQTWLPGSSGSKSHSGWATGISPGLGEEASDQNVFFSVILEDPDGVIEVPTTQSGDRVSGAVDPVVILPDGTLEYTLSGNSGIAQISITLSDDGGTDNGGIDTSDPKYSTIQVVNDASGLPSASYAWLLQLPTLYSPPEDCCFDYSGDGVVDNAYGDLAATVAGLGADANEAMAGLIEDGEITKLLFWDSLPPLGTPGPFKLEFANGHWFGPATFPERVAGMEDFLFDSNGLAGEPSNVQDCITDELGQFSCTSEALTLPLGTNATATELGATTIEQVRIEGAYSDSRVDCDGRCSVDETAGEEPLVRGGFRIGGVLHLDEYFAALNRSYQSCVCFTGGFVELFDYGEGPTSYEFSCNDNGEQAAQCSACEDAQLGFVCQLGRTILVGSADIDTNENGIDDAMSVGIRMGVSGANVVGCIGTDCVPKLPLIFTDSFEDKVTSPD